MGDPTEGDASALPKDGRRTSSTSTSTTSRASPSRCAAWPAPTGRWSAASSTTSGSRSSRSRAPCRMPSPPSCRTALATGPTWSAASRRRAARTPARHRWWRPAYVALPSGDPSGVPGSAASHDVLLAPLSTQSGELLGVLTTVGKIDVADLEAGRLRARRAVRRPGAAGALPGPREPHPRRAAADVRRRAVGAQPGGPAARPRRPAPGRRPGCGRPAPGSRGVGLRGDLGAARRGRVVPLRRRRPARARRLGAGGAPGRRVLAAATRRSSQDDRPLLGRLADLARHEQALLAGIGNGTTVRGALLVLRSQHDRPWSDEERDALRGLGRRFGVAGPSARGPPPGPRGPRRAPRARPVPP